MSDWLQLNPLFPFGWLLAVAVVLLVWLIILEVKRKPQFLGIRVVATFALIAALLMLLLQPSVKQSLPQRPTVLLTSGYAQQTLDTLLEQRRVEIITAPGESKVRGGKPLNSWDDLQRIRPQYVLGEGIPTVVLDQFPTLHYHFIETPVTGVVAMEEKIYRSNRLQMLAGSVRGAQNMQLWLAGPGGVEDSVAVDSSTSTFALRFRAKAPGFYLYRLRAVQDSDTASYIVPVAVGSLRQFKVLLLESFPSFESNTLKNFLSTAGHAVVVRTQIAAQRYQTQYLSHNRSAVELSQQGLANFDLAILPVSMWRSLSSNEKQSIQASMQNGLGVLLLIDQPLQKIPELGLQFIAARSDTAQVELPDGQRFAFLTAGMRWKEAGITPLATDQYQDAVVALKSAGMGKLSVQTLTNTFALELGGQPQAYADVWTSLLESTARPAATPWDIRLTSPGPHFPNVPVHFQVVAAGGVPAIKFDSVLVPLREDVWVDDVWHGTVWPQRSGWQKLKLNDSTAIPFFVPPFENENTLTRYQQLQANRQRSNETIAVTDQVRWTAVPSWIWLTLFLGAACVLWLTPKL